MVQQGIKKRAVNKYANSFYDYSGQFQRCFSAGFSNAFSNKQLILKTTQRDDDISPAISEDVQNIANDLKKAMDEYAAGEPRLSRK